MSSGNYCLKCGQYPDRCKCTDPDWFEKKVFIDDPLPPKAKSIIATVKHPLIGLNFDVELFKSDTATGRSFFSACERSGLCMPWSLVAPAMERMASEARKRFK